MSQPQKVPSQGHTRNNSSSTRSSRPRSSTRGPLDAEQDDVLKSPSTAQLSPTAQLPRRSASSARPDRGTASPQPAAKDFSFLLRPEIYHPITQLNVPPAFRNSPKQPDPQVPLEQLLERGQFRAAAIAAVQELTGSAAGASGRDGVDPRDAKSIFDLLYTRLACLTLIDATPLAAQEVKALEDLNNPSIYVDEATGQHLAPWKLRVLNVRLQALGFGDHRRAVMSYHDLAREARAEISKAAARHDDTARELWKSRLHDLGIQVAGALIDMDDLPGAAHHLDAMPDGGGNKKLPLSRALLWLHLGNAAKARECAARCSGEHDGAHTDTLIQALCDMADADYEAALGKWQGLRETLGAGDEMVGVNTAVCLLYLGRMHEGRDMLQELVGAGASSHTLLFNLATMYELCTDKHRNLKTRLAERVARLDESPAGWEKMNADFKL